MPQLLTGVLALLFAEIEDASRLVGLPREQYVSVRSESRQILRAAVQEWKGEEVDPEGDGFAAAFPRAHDAVFAAVAAQRGLIAHPWPDGVQVRVRMALHTGDAATDLQRCARLCEAGHGWQILLSQATQELVGPDLPADVSLRDLGVHHLKDLARPQRIYQVISSGLPADFPPIRSLDTRPNNLPRTLTSFIGREHEIAEIKRLWLTTRLLTLTGAGGSGKTRLALQVAADLLDSFPDGTWLIDLTSVNDPALVPQTVALACRVQEEAGQSVTDTLVDALRPQVLLLVLDNCEHLVSACAPLVRRVLEGCPEVRVLATSREALKVQSETVWPVPGLPLPDPGTSASLDALGASPAVKLFVARAAAARSGFALTARNAASIADVCQRLDGIPLAIELAAAQVRALAVEQIAKRLDDRFRLLTGRDQTGLGRHQTLRAAMDWSYDLLADPERILLQRLGVFAGGFTLEAAEGICAGDGIAAADVLDLLIHLADKSLVVVEQAEEAEARYRLLDTVRQYALDKLAAGGAMDRLREAHRNWFLAFAERAELELRGDQAPWVERLGLELDNLRAALDWCRSTGESEPGLRLAGAMGMFWDVRGIYREGRRWLEEMFPSDGVDGAVRAKALVWASVLAWRQGHYDRVKTSAEQALALARTHEAEWSMGLALHQLGHAAHVNGDVGQATRLLQESVEVFRQQADVWGQAYSLNCLGDLAHNRGMDDQAAAQLEEAIALWRRLNNSWGLSLSLLNLGNVVLRQGDHHRARALIEESLEICRTIGAMTAMMYCLINLVGIAVNEGQPRRAAQLFGATDALMIVAGVSLEPVNRADYERDMQKAKTALTEAAWTAAWQAGQEMSLEQVLEYARSSVELPFARLLPKTRLTPREMEVAGLISQGLANHEIAATLVVTEQTVETHVQEMLTKLGFTARTEIATWAAEQGLHLALAYDTTIEGWSKALDLRDRETEGHTQRVTKLTLQLAAALSVPEEDLVHIQRGALLHDIGKMGVPDSILLKRGPLTDEEREIMKQHPSHALRLLSPIAYLRRAADIPYCHHEKWDGTGYPRGLKGEQIPLAARIFSVVDVWDALTVDRPYRQAVPKDIARAYIKEQANTHFDPKAVEAFLALDL